MTEKTIRTSVGTDVNETNGSLLNFTNTIMSIPQDRD
jgi:hypothetical protein